MQKLDKNMSYLSFKFVLIFQGIWNIDTNLKHITCQGKWKGFAYKDYFSPDKELSELYIVLLKFYVYSKHIFCTTTSPFLFIACFVVALVERTAREI